MAEPTTLDLITLVVAIFGAVIAVAAIMWNVTAFMLTGARIKVEVAQGVTGPAGMGGLIHGPDVWKNGPPEAGYTVPVVLITVRNVGRSPATVKRVGITAPNKSSYHEPQPASTDGKPLPCRLDAGEDASWYVDGQSAFALSSSLPHRKRHEVWAFAELATGSKIRSKGSIQALDLR